MHQDNGHIHEHAHEHENEHTHMHTHDPEEKRAIVNRLSRAIGHLEKVKRMVEDDEDCSDVLVQLAAVKSAINNTGKLVLKQHIDHCLVEAVEEGDMEAVDRLTDAVDSFVK